MRLGYSVELHYNEANVDVNLYRRTLVLASPDLLLANQSEGNLIWGMRSFFLAG